MDKKNHESRTTGHESPIIVALDVADLAKARKLLENLKGVISFYKIGFELFTAFGWEAVELVREFNGKIFLDLKFHDIPNTVAKTAAVVCDHEIEMFNVHALGGFEMMSEVRKTVDQKISGKKKPIVLGVTILTSHSQETLSQELQIPHNVQDQVLHLAKLASKAGLDGIVSSSQEISLLRKHLPEDFVMVTPGIRPEGSDKGDQKRTFTPREALSAGSNYLVIGRPINAAQSPRDAALSIIASL